MDLEVFDASWQFPGTAIFYGASMSGKSTLVLDLIRNYKQLFGNIELKNVFYVYSSWQQKFDEISRTHPHMTFVSSYKDVPSNISNSVIVYDDQQIIFQSDAAARTHITDVFQRVAHHNCLFCIVILQTIHNNKLRSLALNSTYQVYFPSARDSLQLSFLNREYFPQNKHFLLQVAKDITQDAHGFMVIDCGRRTLDKFRVRNFILPHNNSKVYIPAQNDTPLKE